MTNPGSFGLPNRDLPLATGTDGKGNEISSVITDLWWRLLVRLSQLTPERPLMAVSLAPSPMEFTATTIGNLLVTGGAALSAVLTRGSDSVAVPVPGFIPMAAEDVVTLTYSGTPVVTFVASARA